MRLSITRDIAKVTLREMWPNYAIPCILIIHKRTLIIDCTIHRARLEQKYITLHFENVFEYICYNVYDDNEYVC